MKGTHFSFKFLLSGILMLHSLTALAQSEADGDMGADPGLPAEAPTPPSQTPSSQTPSSPPSQPGRASPGTTTLPAPAPEGLVQPYDGVAPAPGTPKASPAPKARPAITGKLAELNLTAEQAQQIIDIRRQWKPDAEKRLKEDFAFLKQNLAQAMADNSTGEEVRRRFELMQKKYLELQTLKFEKLLRIREVLTPEQRKKFAELRSRPGRNNNNNDND